MNQQMMELERLCNLFLLNFEHPGRKDKVERIIAELHEATKPPDLGISVSEKVGASGNVR